MKLRIGHSTNGKPFYLPDSAVTQTYGILAKRRGGKSYTAAVMAEEFYANNIPWVMLDPTGAHYGLRSSADGSKDGIPAIVLGGAHGDAPLDPHGGKTVAELVVDHPGWCVLDMEAFESAAAQDRFVAAFADRLYRLKAKARNPMHLFIDEADSFIPQRPGPGQLTMLGAFENIVRRGGIRGLGTTLISQRAAVVNKNVLTQLDTLIVLQTTGPQDQDAVLDWVKRNATSEQLAAFRTALASLPRGTAWVYTPEDGIFEQVRIRERKTFNSSKTPEAGETVVVPKRLAKVDLDAVLAAMAETIEKEKANDPALLRKRIGELERQLTIRPTAIEERIVEKTVEVTVPAFSDDDWQRLLELSDSVGRGVAALTDLHSTFQTLMRAQAEARHAEFVDVDRPLPPRFKMQRTVEPKAVRDVITFDPPEVPGMSPIPVPRTQPTVEVTGLKAGARRMLDILARQHPMRVTVSQWATLAGMKKTGGTWGTYVSTLRKAGLFDQDPQGLIGITGLGLQLAGVDASTPPMSSDEVIEMYRSKLKLGARNMLDVLTEVYPRSIERVTLASRINMEASGGTFGTYLSTLRQNGLAEVENGFVRATDTVMGQ